jgi:transcriptional regulator with XRE-family HTH domain
MNLTSRLGLIARLRRGKVARQKLVESHLNKGIAYQLRATREKLGWSQERLSKEVGMNQNAISRLESPDYGRPTLTTLRRLATAFDVALIVRFVPFSELADWVSGTPRIDKGLSSTTLAVPCFSVEESQGIFGPPQPHSSDGEPITAATANAAGQIEATWQTPVANKDPLLGGGFKAERLSMQEQRSKELTAPYIIDAELSGLALAGQARR